MLTRTSLERRFSSEWSPSRVRADSEVCSLRVVDDKQTKALRRELDQAVRDADVPWIRNWCVLGAIVLEGGLLFDARFIEALRPLRLSMPSRRAARDAIRQAIELEGGGIGDDRVIRLRSLLAYVELVIESRNEERLLLQEVHAERSHCLKGLLMLVEDAFVERTAVPRRAVPVATFDGLSAEDIAAAVSYVLATYHSEYGLDRQVFGAEDATTPPHTSLTGLVERAFALYCIRSQEHSVFRAGYRCERTGDAHGFVVRAPSTAHGTAVSLGNLRLEMQQQIAAERAPRDAGSLTDLCRTGARVLGPKIAKISDDEPHRLQIFIPPRILGKLGDEIFTKTALFREEVMLVQFTMYELGATLDELLGFRIAARLTLGDVLSISRCLRFIDEVRRARLQEFIAQGDHVLFRRSAISGMMREDAIQMLAQVGFAEELVREYIELFTWKPGRHPDDGGLVDLQYRSFIDLDGFLVLPLAVHCASNLIRNALVSQKKRLFDDGTKDPVAIRLRDALRQAQATVSDHFEYEHGPVKGEIDVLAVISGKLFVFECKNSLHPTCSAELRTTIDYLNKARQQLDRFAACWRDPSFREWVRSKTGWSETPSMLHTGIVMSHRVLSGIPWFGHPIRHMHEMAAFIEKGITSVTTLGERFEKRHWTSTTFAGDDLVAYLAADNSIYGPLFASSEETLRPLALRKVRCAVAMYGIDQLELLRDHGVDDERIHRVFMSEGPPATLASSDER